MSTTAQKPHRKLDHHCKNLTKQIAEYKKSTEGEPTKGLRKTSQKTSQKILNLIQQNPDITTLEMADNIGIDRRNITRNIKKLVEGGFIKRVGPDKGGHWEVIPQK
jgi:ATP-dependent DNA helicase RecG